MAPLDGTGHETRYPKRSNRKNAPARYEEMQNANPPRPKNLVQKKKTTAASSTRAGTTPNGLSTTAATTTTNNNMSSSSNMSNSQSSTQNSSLQNDMNGDERGVVIISIKPFAPLQEISQPHAPYSLAVASNTQPQRMVSNGGKPQVDKSQARQFTPKKLKLIMSEASYRAEHDRELKEASRKRSRDEQKLTENDEDTDSSDSDPSERGSSESENGYAQVEAPTSPSNVCPPPKRVSLMELDVVANPKIPQEVPKPVNKRGKSTLKHQSLVHEHVGNIVLDVASATYGHSAPPAKDNSPLLDSSVVKEPAVDLPNTDVLEVRARSESAIKSKIDTLAFPPTTGPEPAQKGVQGTKRKRHHVVGQPAQPVSAPPASTLLRSQDSTNPDVLVGAHRQKKHMKLINGGYKGSAAQFQASTEYPQVFLQDRESLPQIGKRASPSASQASVADSGYASREGSQGEEPEDVATGKEQAFTSGRVLRKRKAPEDTHVASNQAAPASRNNAKPKSKINKAIDTVSVERGDTASSAAETLTAHAEPQDVEADAAQEPPKEPSKKKQKTSQDSIDQGQKKIVTAENENMAETKPEPKRSKKGKKTAVSTRTTREKTQNPPATDRTVPAEGRPEKNTPNITEKQDYPPLKPVHINGKLQEKCPSDDRREQSYGEPIPHTTPYQPYQKDGVVVPYTAQHLKSVANSTDRPPLTPEEEAEREGAKKMYEAGLVKVGIADLDVPTKKADRDRYLQRHFPEECAAMDLTKIPKSKVVSGRNAKTPASSQDLETIDTAVQQHKRGDIKAANALLDLHYSQPSRQGDRVQGEPSTSNANQPEARNRPRRGALLAAKVKKNGNNKRFQPTGKDHEEDMAALLLLQESLKTEISMDYYWHGVANTDGKFETPAIVYGATAYIRNMKTAITNDHERHEAELEKLNNHIGVLKQILNVQLLGENARDLVNRDAEIASPRAENGRLQEQAAIARDAKIAKLREDNQRLREQAANAELMRWPLSSARESNLEKRFQEKAKKSSLSDLSCLRLEMEEETGSKWQPRKDPPADDASGDA